jgi:NAD-specific glutamate dehydrogenase
MAGLVGRGVDPATARAFAGLGALGLVADVAATTRAAGRPVADVMGAFSLVDRAFGLQGLEARLAGLRPAGRWERWQLRALGDDIARWRRQAAERCLARPGALAGAVAALLEDCAGRKARFDRLVAELDEPGEQGPALAALAVRALPDLAVADDRAAAGRAPT